MGRRDYSYLSYPGQCSYKSTGENGKTRTKYYLSVPDITFLVQLTVGSVCLKKHDGGLYTTQSPFITKQNWNSSRENLNPVHFM